MVVILKVVKVLLNNVARAAKGLQHLPPGGNLQRADADEVSGSQRSVGCRNGRRELLRCGGT
jgi:hypothetical protein